MKWWKRRKIREWRRVNKGTCFSSFSICWQMRAWIVPMQKTSSWSCLRVISSFSVKTFKQSEIELKRSSMLLCSSVYVQVTLFTWKSSAVNTTCKRVMRSTKESTMCYVYGCKDRLLGRLIMLLVAKTDKIADWWLYVSP